MPIKTKHVFLALVFIPFFSNAQLELGANIGNSIDYSISYKFIEHIKLGIDYSQNIIDHYQNNCPTKYDLPNLFLEYSQTIGRSELYAGLNGGLYLGQVDDYYKYYDNSPAPEIGAQLGYSYRIYKRILINAEIYYRHVPLNESFEYIDIKQKSYIDYEGATIGIHYVFNHKKKKMLKTKEI